MSEEVAVLGATVSVNNGATGAITTPPSTKCKAGGAFIYRGTLTITLAGGQSGTCVGIAGTGTVDPTAQKVEADGQKVIRKGDTGSGTINGTDSGTGAPCSFGVDIEVDDAGQTKVLAE